jgi:hypothetical protein
MPSGGDHLGAVERLKSPMILLDVAHAEVMFRWTLMAKIRDTK